MIATLMLDGEETTARLARALAPHLAAGDTLGLIGGLGTGKSLFARALVTARLAALGRLEEVPSPSFTLVQTYDLDTVDLWHTDLYRIADAGEIAELGLEDAFGAAICLVEWADRLIGRGTGGGWPGRALTLALDFVPGREEARRAVLEAAGPGWDWLPGALASVERTPA